MINHQDSSKMKNIKQILLILIVLSVQCVSAQQKDLKRAKRYFDRTYYSEALPIYEEAVEDKQSLEIVKNLADCYYYTNDLVNAQRWYRYLIKTFNEPDQEYYFRYVQTLKASGNTEEATAFTRNYLSQNPDPTVLAGFEKDIHELENITAIGNRFTIKSLPVNTKNAEFGAVKYGDNLVYSGVANSGLFGKVYKWNNENYLDLVTIPLSNLKSTDTIVATTSFSETVNTAMHEADAIFTKDGKTMYFTRNNFKKGKRAKDKNKVSNLQIFKAELADGKWSNIVALPFNSDDYSTEHPALSNDEKILYFASDMPGTLGSFDIYSVAVNNGNFDVPKNLGNTVNTPRKEQFPFVSKDNKLYFSSNGREGYGSLDVFVSDIKDGTYSKALNIGLPVNSGYDDFAFNIDPDTKEGYFSSNRLEGKGSDDIYGLKETKPLIVEDCKQFISGVITDVDTTLPLDSALVLILDSDGKEIETIKTAADGKFNFTVGCQQSYVLTATKELYSKGNKTVKTGKERYKITDASMALKSEAMLKKEAEVAAVQAKENAVKEKETAVKEKEAEKVRKVAESKKRVEAIMAKEKDIVKDKDRLLIKTEPIYFDYDLWYIRKESKPILNRVIELMKKYPDMVVEIGSHTDVRGNNKYNLDLSSKRAASTRTYFLEQGIPAKRIFSKGYGETVPIIRCVPDDACTEEQHELNRRSEFVIKEL